MRMPYRYFTYCILLTLAVIYTGWLVREINTRPTVVDPSQDRHPDAFAEQVIATNLDEKGNIHNRLITPRIVHYARHDSAVVTQPHIILYGDDRNKQPWHITSVHGRTMNGLDTIYLWDHVKIHEPQGQDNKNLTVTTSRLTIYPDKNYAETKQPVHFTEPGVTVDSVGMKAYLKEKRVELLSQARGVYDAKQAEK